MHYTRTYAHLKLLLLTLLLYSLPTPGLTQGQSGSLLGDYLESCPLLSHSDREDIKALLAQDTLSLPSKIRNSVSILSASPQELKVQTSEISTLSLRLLPVVGGSKLICAIESIESPKQDSQITIYSTNWEPIDMSQLWHGESLSQYLSHLSMTDEERTFALPLLSPNYVYYQWEAGEQPILVGRLQNPLSNLDEQGKRLESILGRQTPLRYVWTGTYFDTPSSH